MGVGLGYQVLKGLLYGGQLRQPAAVGQALQQHGKTRILGDQVDIVAAGGQLAVPALSRLGADKQTFFEGVGHIVYIGGATKLLCVKLQLKTV